MTRLRAALLSLALLLGLAVSWGPLAGPAAACSCAALGEGAAIARADVAFVGNVADRTRAPFAVGRPSSPTTYTFDVLSIVKGDATPRQEVVSSSSSASCGLELEGSGPFLVVGSARPEVGSDPLEAGQLSASLCGGTRALAADEAADFRGATPLQGEQEDGVGRGPVVFLTVVTIGAVLGFVLIVRRHKRRTRGR